MITKPHELFCTGVYLEILFADDTTLFVASRSVEDISFNLTSAITSASDHEWMAKSGFRLNLAKTKCMLVHSMSTMVLSIYVKHDENTIEQVQKYKLLDVNMNHTLSWDDHINHVCLEVSRGMNLLWKSHGFYQEKYIRLHACSA